MKTKANYDNETGDLKIDIPVLPSSGEFQTDEGAVIIWGDEVKSLLQSLQQPPPVDPVSLPTSH
jgi:hypothetical protein